MRWRRDSILDEDAVFRHGSNELDSLSSLNKPKFILKPLSKPFQNEFIATGIVQTVKQDVPILNLA
jgi:hypothetical protein